MYYTEWAAMSWLQEERGIKPEDIFHGSEFTDPTFVCHGNVGYEVKTTHGRTISIARGKYNILRDEWGNGEMLVFQYHAEAPRITIPFSDLPENGGEYKGINIVLMDKSNSKKCLISVSPDEKDKMEIIRGIIENKVIPQRDWGDLLLQSLCAVMYDMDLMKHTMAQRIGNTFYLADCPYCDNQNQLAVGNQLYWLQKCVKCGREFVARRKLENKILT